MKISPDLIPHTEFHKVTWLLPLERPEWYYFTRKRNGSIIKNKTFLKSVDKPLRTLVRWLHKRGIKTTPSCSGHHISERDLEKIYQGLEKDMDDIHNGGLKLKDIETGQQYCYKDKNYFLPWSKEDFVEKVITYQQKGVIGLKLGKRKKTKAKILKILKTIPEEQIDGVNIKEKDSVILIFTTEEKRGDNKETWNKITNELIRALG